MGQQIEHKTYDKPKSPTQKKVEVRRKKILCCLLAGLLPKHIMEKYNIKRHTFYADFDALKIEDYFPSYKGWVALDIAKDGIKAKTLILQAVGYSQKDIAELFNVQRDVIGRLAKFKSDKGCQCMSPILIQTEVAWVVKAPNWVI